MKHIILIFVLAVALTSCAIPDYSQASTLQLCDSVLNINSMPRSFGMYALHDARLEELSRRGEDCSSFMHLRRSVSSDIDVNVN